MSERDSDRSAPPSSAPDLASPPTLGSPLSTTPDDVEEGTVKWYSRARGYGFIVRGDGSELFVHHSALVDRAYRVLDDGQRVRFRTAEGDRGVKAIEVERLSDSRSSP